MSRSESRSAYRYVALPKTSLPACFHYHVVCDGYAAKGLLYEGPGQRDDDDDVSIVGAIPGFSKQEPGHVSQIVRQL